MRPGLARPRAGAPMSPELRPRGAASRVVAMAGLPMRPGEAMRPGLARLRGAAARVGAPMMPVLRPRGAERMTEEEDTATDGLLRAIAAGAPIRPALATPNTAASKMADCITTIILA